VQADEQILPDLSVAKMKFASDLWQKKAPELRGRRAKGQKSFRRFEEVLVLLAELPVTTTL
jgi:hypothetical protein